MKICMGVGLSGLGMPNGWCTLCIPIYFKSWGIKKYSVPYMVQIELTYIPVNPYVDGSIPRDPTKNIKAKLITILRKVKKESERHWVQSPLGALAFSFIYCGIIQKSNCIVFKKETCLDDSTYKYMYSTGCNAPKFYGLPKIYKLDIPSGL